MCISIHWKAAFIKDWHQCGLDCLLLVQARFQGCRRILNGASGGDMKYCGWHDFVPQRLLRRHGALWQHVQLLQGQLHLLLRHLPLPVLLRAPEEPAGPGILQQLHLTRLGRPTGARHRARGQQARPGLWDAPAAEQQVRDRVPAVIQSLSCKQKQISCINVVRKWSNSLPDLAWSFFIWKGRTKTLFALLHFS